MPVGVCAVASVMRAASGCVVLPLASATLGTRSICRVLLVFQILLVCVNCCPTSIEADMGLIETVRCTQELPMVNAIIHNQI